MGNGLTSDQMLERMYTEMVGIDGQSGMKADIRETKEAGVAGRKVLHGKIEVVKEEMDDLQASVVTKQECRVTRQGAGDRKDKVLMRTKDLIILTIAILTVLVTLGVIKI